MGIAEVGQLITLVVTGVIGWWVKRGASRTSNSNERLEGKLDAILAAMALESRARARLEIRIERIERFLRLSPFTPPEGTGSPSDLPSTRMSLRDTLPGPY